MTMRPLDLVPGDDDAVALAAMDLRALLGR